MVWLLLEIAEIPYVVKTVPLRRYMLPGEAKDPEYIKAVGSDGVVPGIQFISSSNNDDEKLNEEEDKVVHQGVENIFYEIQKRWPDKYPDGNINKEVRNCAKSIFDKLRVARKSYEACAGADTFDRDVLLKNSDLAMALDDLDNLLADNGGGGGPYLGNATSPSVADVMILPFLERTAAVVPYFFGPKVLQLQKDERNNDDDPGGGGVLKFARAYRYLHAVQKHCWAYSQLCSDATTIARTNIKYAEINASPRYSVPASVTSSSTINKIEAAKIDGTDLLTYREWACKSNREDRWDAATRLIRNASNVTTFAVRIAGGADLDINDDKEDVVDDCLLTKAVVDASLRVVTTLLLSTHDDENNNDGRSSVEIAEAKARIAVRTLTNEYGSPAVSRAGKVLDVLSVNVGVPRDMDVRSARALRSHVRILVNAVLRQQ